MDALLASYFAQRGGYDFRSLLYDAQMKRLLLLLFLFLLAACSDPPVLDIKIVVPPGDDPLKGVDVVRLHVTDPAVDKNFQVTDPDQINIEVEVAVESAAGVITLEGAAAGKIQARGETPPVLLVPEAGSLSLLVARAGVTSKLGPELKLASLDMASLLLPSLGVFFASGKQASIYDFFTHEVKALPAPPESRIGAVAAPCGNRCITLALGKAGTTLAKTLISYDGAAWTAFSDGLDDLSRRAGAATAPLGDGTYVVAGGVDAKGAALDTLLHLDPGSTSSVPGMRKLSSRSAAARAAPVAAGSGGHALIAGAGKAEVFSLTSLASQAVTLPGVAPHTGAAICALSDGAFLLVGGADAGGKTLRDVWRVDPKTLKVTHYKDALASGRQGHAALQVAGRLVVLGGKGDGAMAAKMELLDATTLKAVTNADQAVQRAGVRANRLGPGSVLISGGVDSAGAAVTSLEVYQRDTPL